MASEGSEGLGVEETPTYSVALTAFVFILISLIAERGIHRLKKYLKAKDQRPLRKALDKMTDELMLLGFISLLLTVFQTSVTSICVTPNFAKHLLPCRETIVLAEAPAPASSVSTFGRKLLNYYLPVEPVDVWPQRRLTEEVIETGKCASKGKVPFVSVEVLHQLHIFIFVLAITHIIYSIITVLLGFARLHNWREWELETRKIGYDGNLDLEKRYCDKVKEGLCRKPHLPGLSGPAHAFIDRNANHWLYENRITLWVVCFFRQFFVSVSKEDYLTFRVGFLNKHKLGDSFNFRDYVVRTMEVDFKKIVGISWWLWLFVVLFLLLNVHGWYTYFWISFVPTIMVLAIGTKQQHIIATLALQAKRQAAQILEREGKISRQDAVVAMAVIPDNKLFWFDSPRLLLKLIHFIIFQNSFEIAIFFWLLTGFGWNSCILGNHTLLIVRVLVGIFTQLLASYTTLPIYALVTQMGTELKDTVFRKPIYENIVGWTNRARERAKNSPKSSEENSQQSSQENSGQLTENRLRIEIPEDGSSMGESVEGPREVTVERLRTLPRERTLRRERSSNRPNLDDPDESLRHHCEKYYGKEHAHRMLSMCRLPSNRDHFSMDE